MKKIITWMMCVLTLAVMCGSVEVSEAAVGRPTQVSTVEKSDKNIQGKIEKAYATCKSSIKNPTIHLNKTSLSLKKGSSVTLKATVKGKSSKVTWSSNNTSIATVSSSGKVTGKKKGTTYIIAKANGVAAKCKVTIVEAENLRSTFEKAAKGKWMLASSATFNEYSRFTTTYRVYYNRTTGKVIQKDKITAIKKMANNWYRVQISGKYGKYELRCQIKNGKIVEGLEYWWYDNGWHYSGSSSPYYIGK